MIQLPEEDIQGDSINVEPPKTEIKTEVFDNGQNLYKKKF